MVPHNRFGDLVEAALRVEKSTRAMYQSRQESKRTAPGTSQQSSGQSSKKKNKGRGYIGRGASQGAISSQGSVRPTVVTVAPRVFLPYVICVGGDILVSVKNIVQGVSIVAGKAISLESALS